MRWPSQGQVIVVPGLSLVKETHVLVGYRCEELLDFVVVGVG
jgi:hypothetical protein